MNSLLLDLTNWDLCADADGNIALASEPYSAAQDVACAARLFQGEIWYATTVGIPYWASILGQLPPIALMKAQYVAAALGVSTDIATAACFLSSVVNRVITGQIQITLTSGATAAIGVGGPQTILTEFAITDTGTPGVTDSGQEVVVG